jgi:hypothetical protein
VGAHFVGANAAVKVKFHYEDGKPSIVLEVDSPDDAAILQIIGDKPVTSSRVTNGVDSPKLLTIEFGGK